MPRAQSDIARCAALVALAAMAAANAVVSGTQDAIDADVLLRGGHVLDGAGNPWIAADVATRGDRIVFVGQARQDVVRARETVDVSGRIVAPGFWDVHSHADFSTPDGRQVLPLLYQGVTTIILGADGNGTNEIDASFERYRRDGIQVNALQYVGHNAARTAVLGASFGREATPDEIARMRAYVDAGMRQGAIGLSTGLAYNPGYYATTEEVIALAEVARAYGGVYDTHDRDMGASYKGIGYLASVREAIAIAERAGLPLIFSHFSPLGAEAHAQLPQAVALIEAARSRGINVMAGQHVYTASSSSFIAHTLPRHAAVGGLAALRARFEDQAAWGQLEREIPEVLALRGGAAKIVITDGPKALSGRPLAEIAQGWHVSVAEAVRRIIREAGDTVYDMNLDIYDLDDIRLLAQKEWMMTCTDGFVPVTRELYAHPRSFGTFPRKLRQFVHEERLISLPFAVRGMTSLPAAFLGIPDRGLVKPGFFADLVVFDESELRDMATYESPFEYARGIVHVMVNGSFALRDGKPTEVLAGRPIRRGGASEAEERR